MLIFPWPSQRDILASCLSRFSFFQTLKTVLAPLRGTQRDLTGTQDSSGQGDDRSCASFGDRCHRSRTAQDSTHRQRCCGVRNL